MGSSLNLKGGTSTPKSIVEIISQANSFTAGDAVRYDIATSTWVKAQADSAENSEVAGVVSANTSSTFDITYSGYISIPVLAGVSAPVLFLDSTTAGGLTASPPSAIGTVVKPVLTKTSTGTGFLVTNYLGTQIGGSSTVAIDEIQPVGTVVPFAGSAIPDSWLACDGNSYAVGTYPNLYAKLQNSSGDRVPAYGYVATLTGPGVSNFCMNIGDMVQFKTTAGTFSGQANTTSALYESGADIIGLITNITGSNQATGVGTATVQIISNYNSTTKKFQFPTAVFTAGVGILTPTGSGNYRVLVTSSSIVGGPPGTLRGIAFLTVSTVAITHFNTPDLRGRFALGSNATAMGEIDGDLSGDTNYSTISGGYSMGSQGGQEFVVATPVTINNGSGTPINAINNIGASSNIANMPPYTVVRYIIKASPYTRAAIIDGIDIPYTSLLVGDLRDGTLRPGGSGEDLVFKTNNGTSGTERMRLTNAGFLGIGTIAPYGKFVVSNSGAEGVEFLPGHFSNGCLIQGVNRLGGYTTLRFDSLDFIFNTSIGSSLKINSSGQVNIAATTESTSLSTGGLTLGGGLGMALNLTVGGGISAAGGITFSSLTRVTNITPSTSTATGALTVVGGVGVGGALFANAVQANSLNASGNTPSTNTGSGSLVVAGGVGIAGALNVGGGISAGGSLNVVGGISASGALTVGGGITAARLDCSGVMKSGSITTGSFSATSLVASDNTQSTSTGTGALTVGGGVGIVGALNVGGGITAAGSLDLGSGAIRTSGSLNCGNIVSAGTFQANSLNATAVSVSTSTGSGALVVGGGAGIGGALNVGGGISAGGGITSAGNLNLGAPRNYTNSGGHSPNYMMRALGSHTNTKIQLVSTGNSESFGGNASEAGAALLMWASEPNQTYSGCGIGANLTTSPGGAVAENRQFTQQAQTFIRFTDIGRIGFHTSAIGATASMTPNVAILSTGGLDVASGIASTSSASGALVVTGAGGAGIGGALNVGGGITAARLDVSNGIKLISGGFNTSTYVNITDTGTSTSTGSGALVVAGGAGIAGALYVGGITATASIAPGAWANGSAPKSYISTAAPVVGNFPVSGSIWFVV